jgi:hypothetical protein
MALEGLVGKAALGSIIATSTIKPAGAMPGALFRIATAPLDASRPAPATPSACARFTSPGQSNP